LAQLAQDDRREWIDSVPAIAPNRLRLTDAQTFHADAAVMLIQSFGNKADVRDDFDNFDQSLNAERIGTNIYSVTAKESPELYLAWCQGDPKFLEAKLPSAPQFAHA
jgi:hypothetical protein